MIINMSPNSEHCFWCNPFEDPEDAQSRPSIESYVTQRKMHDKLMRNRSSDNFPVFPSVPVGGIPRSPMNKSFRMFKSIKIDGLSLGSTGQEVHRLYVSSPPRTFRDLIPREQRADVPFDRSSPRGILRNPDQLPRGIQPPISSRTNWNVTITPSPRTQGLLSLLCGAEKKANEPQNR